MSEPAFKTTIFDGPEAPRRLRALNLTLEGLGEVVRQGEYARAEATDHDPITAGGFDAYRYRVRGLRDVFCPLGWLVERDRNLEMIRSACGKRSIITRAGDNGVGLRGAHPQPKRFIGEVTANAVHANSNLLFHPDWLNVAPTTVPDHETWMLLVYRANDNDIVRSELSLPTETVNNERVLGWAERILLPDIDLSDPTPRKSEYEPEPEIIDPPVIRKR